jgi:hypothetical protein
MAKSPHWTWCPEASVGNQAWEPGLAELLRRAVVEAHPEGKGSCVGSSIVLPLMGWLPSLWEPWVSAPYCRW